MAVCGNEREEQGRQSSSKVTLDRTPSVGGEGGGDSARDGSSVSGPGPARPERERGAARASQSHKARTELRVRRNL